MKLAWSDEDEAFRGELITFLDGHTPPELAQGYDFQGDVEDGPDLVPQYMRDWQATLFDHGWMIPAYGPELGGRNCTPLQTLWKVYVPLARPTYLAYALVSVSYHWNNFLWPLIITNSVNTRPLTVGLAVFATTDQGIDWSIVSAATVTSDTLTAGQWNYVPLENPIMLSVGGGASFAHADAGGTASYIACTAFTGNFPDTDAQFGPGVHTRAASRTGH